jgi:hypothetical protein
MCLNCTLRSGRVSGVSFIEVENYLIIKLRPGAVVYLARSEYS